MNLDSIPSFEIRGHRIEAQVMPGRAFAVAPGQLAPTSNPAWVVVVDGVQMKGFPSWFDDTESDVRERITAIVETYLAK